MAQSKRSLIDAVTRHQVLLERLKTGSYEELNSVLDEYGAEIRATILMLNVDELVRLTRSQLQQLVADLQLIERQILSPEVRRFQRDVLPDIAASESAFEVKLLSNAVAASKTFDAVITTPAQGAAMLYAERLPVNATGQLLEKVISNWERGEVERLENMVQRAFVEGRTTRQLANDIWAPELFETKRRAEAVARTAIQHVSQSAREQVWIDNDDIVEKYEFVATLDSRTTSQCFEGSTIVQPIGEVRKVFRRFYEGDFITIRTAAGKEISSTPNHPILTPCGWRAAKEINPSEKIVNVRLSNLVPVPENVEMHASFKSFFDSLDNPSVGNVVVKRSSSADFHGDGCLGNEEIDVVVVDCKLRNDGAFATGNDSVDKSIVIGHDSGFLPSICGIDSLFISGSPSINSTEIAPELFESNVKTTFGDPSLSNDFRRSNSIVEHFNGDEHKVGACGSLDINKEIKLFEECGNCRGSCAVMPCNASGTLSASISFDDVISVRSEFRSCHVYNFETSSGIYLVNGYLVSNCRSLDGQTFKVGQGPRPPIHFNCRSTTVPVLGPEFDFLDEGATRASVKGPVDADLTYYDWLKTQPPSFQDAAIGKARGKLLRDGGLSAKRFADLNLGRNFEPLTLDEMREMEPLAFERAGI